MENKISIICTVFNDQDEIKRLLEDINMQTLLPNEIIIADGGSKDDTVKIIKNYKDNNIININLISGERLNISQGLNVAIKNSKNEVIVIMSTGNRYDKNFIKELFEKFTETNADIVFAPIRGNNDSKFSKLYNRSFLNNEYGSRIPSNHGVLIKKEVFEKIGLFYEKFIYAGEDAEFFERARINELHIECAENAKIKWDVPNNLKTFKKQINNYTIAKIQIESFSIFKKYRNNYIIILMLIITILSILYSKYYVGTILAIMYAFLLIYKYLKNEIDMYMLREYRRWLEIKIILSNLNKFKNKYKVNKEIIEKL